MNEMVERGARAIVECEGLGDAAMPQARKFVRVVIAALRAPTPEILNVGIQGGTGGTLCSWQMMIDEMLK